MQSKRTHRKNRTQAASAITLALWLAATPAFAQNAEGLTHDQQARLLAARRLVAGVDARSVREAHAEITATSYVEENLQILEAVARTYDEIVREYDVRDQSKKDWLYSMVKLNMAYLQMGGITVSPKNNTALSKLIIKKLTTFLPPEILNHPEMFFTVIDD